MGGHNSAETEGERGTWMSRFACRRSVRAKQKNNKTDSWIIGVIFRYRQTKVIGLIMQYIYTYNDSCKTRTLAVFIISSDRRKMWLLEKAKAANGSPGEGEVLKQLPLPVLEPTEKIACIRSRVTDTSRPTYLYLITSRRVFFIHYKGEKDTRWNFQEINIGCGNEETIIGSYFFKDFFQIITSLGAVRRISEEKPCPRLWREQKITLAPNTEEHFVQVAPIYNLDGESLLISSKGRAWHIAGSVTQLQGYITLVSNEYAVAVVENGFFTSVYLLLTSLGNVWSYNGSWKSLSQADLKGDAIFWTGYMSDSFVGQTYLYIITRSNKLWWWRNSSPYDYHSEPKRSDSAIERDEKLIFLSKGYALSSRGYVYKLQDNSHYYSFKYISTIQLPSDKDIRGFEIFYGDLIYCILFTSSDEVLWQPISNLGSREARLKSLSHQVIVDSPAKSTPWTRLFFICTNVFSQENSQAVMKSDLSCLNDVTPAERYLLKQRRSLIFKDEDISRVSTTSLQRCWEYMQLVCYLEAEEIFKSLPREDQRKKMHKEMESLVRLRPESYGGPSVGYSLPTLPESTSNQEQILANSPIIRLLPKSSSPHSSAECLVDERRGGEEMGKNKSIY